jgi:hypothetical protein
MIGVDVQQLGELLLGARPGRGQRGEGLNTILLVGAIVAFAGAALALVLIRQRDYAPAEAEISGVPVPA